MYTGFAAYFYVQASIVMMLGSGLPIITSILSYFVFRRSLSKHEKIGLGIIFISLLELGFKLFNLHLLLIFNVCTISIYAKYYF